MDTNSDTSAQEPSDTTKVAHIRLTPQSVDILETIKTTKGISNTEAVNRALALFSYMIDKQEAGWEVTATKKGHEVRYMEIVGM